MTITMPKCPTHGLNPGTSVDMTVLQTTGKMDVPRCDQCGTPVEFVEYDPDGQLREAVEEAESLRRRLVREMTLTRTATEMREEFGPDYERYLI